nr:hypothetical protein [Tanacetum cinerariifolium]
MLPSSSSEHVADEAAHKKRGDSLIRAATTASSLKAEQDSGYIDKTQSKATHNEASSPGTTSGSGLRATTTASSLEAEQDSGYIDKTQSKATHNEASSPGTTSGSGLRCQKAIGDTVAQTWFENVSKLFNESLLVRGNTLRSNEDSMKLNKLMALCTNLQSRVLTLEKTKTTQALWITSLKRRFKKLEKKQRSRTHKLKRLYNLGLIARVDSSKYEQNLGEDASKRGRKINDIDVDEDITLVNDQDDSYMFDINYLHGEEVFVDKDDADKEVNADGELNATSIATTISAAAIITTEEVTLAKALTELKASKTKVKEVVIQEPSESTTATTKTTSSKQSQDKAQKELKANIALIVTWDDVQAKIDVDYQMAERLQGEEQQELTDEEKATLFMQLLEKRRKFLQAFKKVNTFVDFRTELVEGSSKRAGEELTQEKSKKQKVDDDKETSELEMLMEIIPNEEEVKEKQEKDKIGSKPDKNVKHLITNYKVGLRRVVPKNYNPKGERPSSKLSRDQTSNPTSSTNPTLTGSIRRSSKQKVENFNFEENLPLEVLIADNRTMAQLLQAPTEGSSTPAISSDVAELKDMVRALLLDKKNQYSAPTPSLTPAPIKAVKLRWYSRVNQPLAYQAPAYQAPVPQTQSVSQTDFERYIKANDAVLRNIQSQGQRSGTLPGNTITNPKEDLKGITTRSVVAYQGPTIPTSSKVVKQGTEVTKDQVQTPNSQSTAPVQPTVIQSQSKTHVSEPVPFTDALMLMPKFASTLKAFIRNKEKLSEMARTSMNEHCSAVILNKLPRKLRDPDKFLIPCKFPGMDECLALADLDASINLIALSMWKGLSLPELTLTCMTLELADRSQFISALSWKES